MKHISDPDHTINRRLHKLYPPEIAERAVNDIIDLIFKYKQRTKFRRMRGHRQYYTRLRIDAINV